MLFDAYCYLLDKKMTYVNTKRTITSFKETFEDCVNSNIQKSYECGFVLDLLKRDLKIYGSREIVWINLETIQGFYIPTGYTLPIIHNSSEYEYYIETTLSHAYNIFMELNKCCNFVEYN